MIPPTGPRPLTPEMLATGLHLASDPQISPDGTRIAYTLSSVDPSDHRTRRRVWTCGVDGGEPTPVAPKSENSDGGRWSPDGMALAFVSTRDAPVWSTLVIVELGDGRTREVLRHRRRIGELAWSPDGRSVAYTTLFDPDDPDEHLTPEASAARVRVTRRLDFKEDGRGYLGDVRTQVFVTELTTGQCRRLTSPPCEHDMPQWSPDGRSIGARLRLVDKAGQRLVLIDAESGATECVGDATGEITHYAWSPDGGRLVLAADLDGALQPDYHLYERATGKLARVTAELRPVPDVSPPVWTDERHVLIHAVEAGASILGVLDVDAGLLETVDRPRARLAGLSADRARRLVAQAESSLESVGELRVFEQETKHATTITRHNRQLLDAQPPARWEAFTVRRGDVNIDAWLLKPPDFDPGRRYPVILDVHGGPNGNYGYGFIAHEQCLATHGFLVVYSNPRGSTSYGPRFAQAVVEDWGGVDYEDVIAVLDVVLERPYADSERTGIFGISYGGYLTAWALGQTDRFAAAVCGEPIFDLESDYGTSDVAFNGLERYGGGPPHERKDWYSARSPSTHAHRTRTPTLIFHGEEDARCPIGQSEQMFVALRKAGCEVEYVRYPGGYHMFFAEGPADQRADFLGRTLSWFEAHLGGPVPNGDTTPGAATRNRAPTG